MILCTLLSPAVPPFLFFSPRLQDLAAVLCLEISTLALYVLPLLALLLSVIFAYAAVLIWTLSAELSPISELLPFGYFSTPRLPGLDDSFSFSLIGPLPAGSWGLCFGFFSSEALSVSSAIFFSKLPPSPSGDCPLALTVRLVPRGIFEDLSLPPVLRRSFTETPSFSLLQTRYDCEHH